MTGVKVAIYCAGIVGGFSTSVTGLILANAPVLAEAAVSQATPITLGLVTAGISTAVVLAWKLSRAWTTIEVKLGRIEERLNSLEGKK